VKWKDVKVAMWRLWMRVRKWLYNNPVVKTYVKNAIKDALKESLESAKKEGYIDDEIVSVVNEFVIESGLIDQFVEEKWSEYVAKPEESG